MTGSSDWGHPLGSGPRKKTIAFLVLALVSGPLLAQSKRLIPAGTAKLTGEDPHPCLQAGRVAPLDPPYRAPSEGEKAAPGTRELIPFCSWPITTFCDRTGL